MITYCNSCDKDMSMFWLGDPGSPKAKCFACYDLEWEAKMKRRELYLNIIVWGLFGAALIFVGMVALLK